MGVCDRGCCQSAALVFGTLPWLLQRGFEDSSQMIHLRSNDEYSHEGRKKFCILRITSVICIPLPGWSQNGYIPPTLVARSWAILPTKKPGGGGLYFLQHTMVARGRWSLASNCPPIPLGWRLKDWCILSLLWKPACTGWTAISSARFLQDAVTQPVATCMCLGPPTTANPNWRTIPVSSLTSYGIS